MADAKATGSPAAKNAAAAPMIYFDEVLTFGFNHGGIVQLELSAVLIHFLGQDKTAMDRTTTGHLRCSIPAAKALRSAIDGALAMADKTVAPQDPGFKDYPRQDGQRLS